MSIRCLQILGANPSYYWKEAIFIYDKSSKTKGRIRRSFDRPIQKESSHQWSAS